MEGTANIGIEFWVTNWLITVTASTRLSFIRVIIQRAHDIKTLTKSYSTFGQSITQLNLHTQKHFPFGD